MKKELKEVLIKLDSVKDLLQEKADLIQEKADNRDSGDMTEKEQEKYDNLNDSIEEIETLINDLTERFEIDLY